MTYTVKSGDSLTSIAARFGMTVAQLQSLNGITDANKLQIGQVLKVNGSSGTVPKTTNYTVKSGDSLTAIASRFGMTVAQLQSLNGITDPNKLKIGQVLKVYDNGGAATPKTTNYTVNILFMVCGRWRKSHNVK